MPKTKSSPKEQPTSKEQTILSKVQSKLPVVSAIPGLMKSLKEKLPAQKKWALVVFAVLIIGALVYRYKGIFVVALVNGKPITRIELIKELESQGGKQALDSLVTKNLINQEVAKRNIGVAQSEIDAEIVKIEENLKGQNLTLDKALSLQGLTKEALIEQISLQKKLERILADKIAVTDEEITKYMGDNKDSLPKDGNVEEAKAQVRDLLSRQKFSTEVKTWLTSIKSGASIKYFVNGLKAGD